MLTINRTSEIPIFRQIYREIRHQILQGEMKPGEKIPSTRELAVDLGISRIVAVEAYELLSAEGYLESQGGSGTYVARGAAFKNEIQGWNSETPDSPDVVQQPKDFVDFRSGIPALDCFPRKKWAEMAYRVALDVPEELLGYDCPEGRGELREAVVRHIQKNRGVQCAPDQVLIISGAVQGLRLIAQAMVHRGFPVLVEDPCNRDIRRIFDNHGAEVHPMPVDDHGIVTADLSSFSKKGLIIATPSHQFPLGGNMPVQRRIELIRWAHATGSFIVEDDYDSEYRYEGPPISSMQGLDPERVIYLGTFSKLLFPALRLGYMVAPHHLITKFRELKRLSDIHSNSLNQLTLAQFIREGHLERHIMRMKKIYRARRNALMNVLESRFPHRVGISGMSTGLHLIAQFENAVFSEHIVNRAYQEGIGIYPVDVHYMKPGIHRDKLIIGYGHLPEERIIRGIERLKNVLG